MKRIVLIGAGGYARSVVDSLGAARQDIAGFLEQYSDISEHMGYPVIARSLEEFRRPEDYRYFICVGNNRYRQRWYDRLREKGLELLSVIDPSAVVSDLAVLGKGCFVGKMAVVNGGAVIGNNVIINTKALVEHGCRVEDHANISTGAILNGDVRVGRGAFAGSRSVVNGQLSIGAWSVIGSGAVVIRDLDEGKIAVGCPAAEIGNAGDAVLPARGDRE